MHLSLSRAALAALGAALVFGATATRAATSGGDYTAAQRSSGATVYAGQCAQCHGTNLQGGSGPALSGSAFRQSIDASYTTAAKLHDFIRSQMPANAPGSLSAKQYIDVTAFVLSRNGFPAGTTALSAANASSVQLAGTRFAPTTETGKVEIVRAAAPTRHVWNALPASTDVNVTDAMMRNAENDQNNWLVHGRTYDNRRYSPLAQINTGNVTQLMPVAVVQTGMVASFETTPIVVNGVMYLSTPTVNNQMKIMAVNAATGARVWETTYNLTPFKICCGPVNRASRSPTAKSTCSRSTTGCSRSTRATVP